MAEDLPTLEDVIQNRLLLVPDYQRPYAWDETNLADLWEDLDLLGTDRHYAGTLVMQRTDRSERTRSGQELTVFEVVDGQQRLTTCFILLEQVRRALKAFHHLAHPESQDAVAELDRLLRVHVAGVQRPRLELAADVQEFFSRSIMGHEVPDQPVLVVAAQRLRSASDHFYSRLHDLIAGSSEAEAIRRLLEVRARVCYQLRFLVYNVESSAEVGVLFETLNGRGQELSELELVKNYLLYLARQLPDSRSDELARQINAAWSRIFASMAKLGLSDDALLRAHWFATVNANSRDWRGAASIKRAFPRSKYVHASGRFSGEDDVQAATADTVFDELFNDVSEYVEGLRKCSTFFRDLFDPQARFHFDEPYASRARRATDSFVRSGATANFWPLLFATRLRYPANGALYCSIVELCEKFSARVYAICVNRPNAGRSSLGYLARDLYSGVDAEDVLAAITNKLWQFAPDSQVRANFAAGINWYGRRGHKYLLFEYELAVVREAGDLPTYADFTSVGPKTTEHVLPQTPAEGSQWQRDFTAQQREQLTNGIGNLVLTRDNSVYGRKDYINKRGQPGQEDPRCYLSRTALIRERDIAQSWEVWTPESIESRRQQIEDWALTRWAVPAPDTTETLVDGNDDDDEPAAI